MRFRLISASGLILLSLLACALAANPEPSPWLEIHSAHYTVITDAGEKRGKEVAVRFEQMRAVFASLLMKERLNEPVPLTILAFRNDKNYYQSAPLHQGEPINNLGFFLPGDDQNFIVLNLFEVEPWRAVAHDFAHMLLNYNYPPAQGWFDEGLAEYFSSIRIDDKRVEIGADPELKPVITTDLLENQHQARNPPKSLTELLSGQVWLALPDLLTMQHDTSTYSEGTHNTLFYAQSWMMVHYLLHEKKMPETGTYFDLVENQQVPVEDAIQKAYGMAPLQLDQAVKEYFHSLTPLFLALDASKQANSFATPQPYQFPQMVGANDSVITARVLPVNDALVFDGEIKIRIPERRDAGLKELQTLAATPDPAAGKSMLAKLSADKIIKKNDKTGKDDPLDAPLISATGNEMAHRILAWDHIQRNEFDAATEELSDAAVLNQSDTWIRYYSAVLKYRIAASNHVDIVGLPNMMLDLRAVLEWYPEFADADDLLATARREGGGPVAALQAESAAIRLSPRNQQYVYHLAEIYMSDKKWDAARALLGRLKTSNDAQVAAASRTLLEQLADVKKYGVSPSITASTQPVAAQKSPFDVLDEDAAKRASAEQAAKSAGTVNTRPAKYLRGQLVSVDCSQAPAAVLTVSAGGSLLKLRTADYKSLLLIGAGTFSCSWSDRAISVNYKPGGVADGDLVSLEVR